MKRERIEYRSSYDNELLVAYHTQVVKPLALIVILHGMAEHQKRYQLLVDECIQNNFNVLTLDHRGHGESLYHKNIKGYFADEGGYLKNLDDIHALVDKINLKEKLPLVIFGHSMGSFFARSFLKHYPQGVSALYLSGSPDYNPIVKIARLSAKIIALFKGKQFRSVFLNDQIYKKFNQSITNPVTDMDWLSFNRENVKAYKEDPLCGYLFTTQAMIDLSDGLIDVYENESWNVLNPMLPIHFISGKYDPSYLPHKLEFALNRIKEQGYTNGSLEYVDNARHEIFNEDCAPLLRSQFIAWIKQVLSL